MTVALRKQSKDDMLSKRRNVCIDDDEPTSPLQDTSNRQNKIEVMSVEEIRDGIFSDDFQTAFKATQAARYVFNKLSKRGHP